MRIGWMNLTVLDEHGQVLTDIRGTMSSFFQFTIGGFDTQLDILLILMACDVVTGTIAGIKTTGFISGKCRDGITKKIMTIILVSVCHMLGIILELPAIRAAAIIAFALNEVASIFENVERMGYGKLIPEKIRNILNVAKEKELDEFKNKIEKKK